MQKTVEGVYAKMRGMRRTGSAILGENTLAWAAEQAKANPALADEVEWLTRHIERKFSRMGDRVRIVNGQILTGSKREWRSIQQALTAPAERARQEVTAAFTAIQQKAIGSLNAMGFSQSEARALVRGMEAGGERSRVARGITKAGPGAIPVIPSRGAIQQPKGDAWGADATASGWNPSGSAASTGGNLMGAKPRMAGYAGDASQYGLRVSSGLRPGAVTNAGNRSYHASGDALDLAGPASAMKAFAEHAASKYGSRLEELIYSPLGWSIKNGRRVAPYAVADHYDHVHIADTAAGGGGGPSFPFSPDTLGPGLQRLSLTAPGTTLGGLPGAAVTAAGGLYAAALQQRLNDTLDRPVHQRFMGDGLGRPHLSAVSAVSPASGGVVVINHVQINAGGGQDPQAGPRDRRSTPRRVHGRRRGRNPLGQRGSRRRPDGLSVRLVSERSFGPETRLTCRRDDYSGRENLGGWPIGARDASGQRVSPSRKVGDLRPCP
jgi:hypothetical protein